jgi:acyl-CoA thioesterase-1
MNSGAIYGARKCSMRIENNTLRSMSAAPSLRTLFVLAFLLLAGAGCGDAQKKVSRLPADAVVLAFGDSLTFGTGAQAQESYPAQLEPLIGRRVVRAGIPGEVTAQALARLPAALDEHEPKLLLLCIGGNDFLRRLGNRQAEENVRAMVKLARGRGVEVMLIATPEPGLRIVPPAFYGAIAKEFGLLYEDDVIGDVLKDGTLKADQVHPNAKGYRIIAERLAEILKRSGAI